MNKSPVLLFSLFAKLKSMKKHISILLLTAACIYQLRAGSFTEHHTVNCGTMLSLGRVGYPTWNPATVIQAAAHGEATVSTINLIDSLFYQAAPNYEGLDTFIVACAHATQITCDTGIYIIETVCNTNAARDLPAIKADLNVYPNPTAAVLNIGCEWPIMQLRICAANGILVLEKRWPIAVTSMEIPVGHLPRGVYWLQATDGQAIVSKKLVIGAWP
jgi:hypothetical protein